MHRSIRIREFTLISKADSVDRENGIIYGLAILGPESQNGYGYREQAMRNALKLYERKRSNANHTPPGSTTSIYDRLGVWYNPRFEGGIIKGDFHFLKSHPLAERLCEAAERPDLNDVFGFSHDAYGREEPGSNGKFIEAIESVETVDLVADPATVKGLHESIHKRRHQMSKKRKRYKEDDDATSFYNSGTTPGASGNDEVAQAVALLQKCVDNAGSRHDPKFVEDVKEAIELLTPWLDEDDNDNNGSAQESRRPGAGGGLRELRFPGVQYGADDVEGRKARVTRMRRGY